MPAIPTPPSARPVAATARATADPATALGRGGSARVRTDRWPIGVAGIAAGITTVTWLRASLTDETPWWDAESLGLAPAIAFAAWVGTALLLRRPRVAWRLPVWVACVGLAWELASASGWRVARVGAPVVGGTVATFVGATLAGALGAAIVAAGTAFVEPSVRRREAFWLVTGAGALGGFAGMLALVPTIGVAVFLTWQAAVGVALATALEERSPRPEPPDPQPAAPRPLPAPLPSPWAPTARRGADAPR